MDFSRVEIITGTMKLTGLINRLSEIGVSGITVSQVLGCGVQKGSYEYVEKENEVMQLLPKNLVLIVCENSIVDRLIEIVKEELYTGHIGDGKIFISDMKNIIRVRTGEEGAVALKQSELD